MNAETRIKKIAEIVEKNKDRPYGKEHILWHDDLVPMDVFEIPLECLVYNKYNGRILSRTKTLEKQGRLIDVETPEGKGKIEELLWESKETRNEITRKDMELKGQLKVGIITKDGIVIDGNRRVMLLNRINKCHFFKAIVLPVALEDEPIEIQKLETMYQMGEDEKLGYNPIEKYLKANQLYKKLIEQYDEKQSIDFIASWMGETTAEIKHYLAMVNIIDDYLQYLGYDGIYAMADTPNDGKEDLFIYLKNWITAFEDKDSNKAFDGYNNVDVDDLKTICFDYIRAKIGKSYDGKQFRYIAEGLRKNHFFGNKKIWQSFCSAHRAKVTSISEQIDIDYPIDFNSPRIEQTLSDRDTKFRDAVLDILVENIEEHVTKVKFGQAADRPLELIGNASKAVDAIDRRHSNFSSPEVQEQIESLAQKAIDMLMNKSPDKILSIIVHLLNSIRFAGGTSTKEALSKIKDIEKVAYQLEKQLKSL